MTERTVAIEVLRQALIGVGDGLLDNLCWCGEEWIGEDDPLDEEREHAGWCLNARDALDATEKAVA